MTPYSNSIAQTGSRRPSVNTPVQVPVQVPVPGRSEMVQNNTGGFTFQLDKWGILRRFLVNGCEGGTYYVNEKSLVKANHTNILACIKEDGQRVVRELLEISTSGRAMKNEAAILVLALACSDTNLDTKRAALQAVPQVCRIGTHLFNFAEYVQNFRGWGRALRLAISKWYTEKTDNELAYQLIKYQQRNGWSHGDLIRLAHPTAKGESQEAMLRWALHGLTGLHEHEVKRNVGKVAGKTVTRSENRRNVQGSLPLIIEAFEEGKTASTARLVELITTHNLPREAIPTEKLNEPAIWEALLQKMPLTATIRNLAKMTAIGLIAPLSVHSQLVVQRLTNPEYLKKSMIHPMALLVALKTYALGHGDKGSLIWTPNQQIVTALDAAFYLSYGNVVPSGVPTLLALDISGSMGGSKVANTNITAREATAAVSLITAATEPNHHILGFSDKLIQLKINPKMRLDEVMKNISNLEFGSTEIALPFKWATANRIPVGGFVTYTDNEVNTGGHPYLALKEFRNRFNPQARSVVCATDATPFTVADPTDAGTLDIAGFDAATPQMISDFFAGR